MAILKFCNIISGWALCELSAQHPTHTKKVQHIWQPLLTENQEAQAPPGLASNQLPSFLAYRLLFNL